MYLQTVIFTVHISPREIQRINSVVKSPFTKYVTLVDFIDEVIYRISEEALLLETALFFNYNTVNFISTWRPFVSQKSFETKDQDYSLKENQARFRNNHIEKSALAKHGISTLFFRNKITYIITQVNYIDLYKSLYLKKNYKI